MLLFLLNELLNSILKMNCRNSLLAYLKIKINVKILFNRIHF